VTTIGVAIPAHAPRARNGCLDRALASVNAQTRLPDEVHVAFDTERRGAWHTRQRALDAVTADFTAFLDSDDELLESHLELHEQWANEHDADFVYSWFHIMPEHRAAEDPFPEWFFTDPWYPDKPRHTTMTVMVRTELAKAVGFTPPIPNADVGHEDFRFLMGCVEAGAKIVHIPGVRTWTWWWETENTSGLAYKEGEPTW
jgi:hypothetical protein